MKGTVVADRFREQHARINELLRLPLTDLDADPMAIHRRLLSYAKTGINDPSLLSELEIKKVCYALRMHYNAMGIE